MAATLKDCRLYVCQPQFGNLEDKCIFFETYEQYLSYLQNPSNEIHRHNSSFQPICNSYLKSFDKVILALRNNKTRLPKIEFVQTSSNQ